MRLRNVRFPGAIAEHPLCILEENPQAGNWHTVFGNNHPIHIEVGMGKVSLSQHWHSRIRKSTISVLKNIPACLSVLWKNRCTGDTAGKPAFCPYGCWKYLQYVRWTWSRPHLSELSDPWPKDRHAKRRLTSTTYLGRYDKILKPEGHVEFKTDNKDLFQFSLEQVEPAGWHRGCLHLDLHHDEHWIREMSWLNMSRSFLYGKSDLQTYCFPITRPQQIKNCPQRQFYLFPLSRKTLSQQFQFCSCQFQAPFFCSKKIQFFSFCNRLIRASRSLPLTLYHALPDTQVPAVPVPGIFRSFSTAMLFQTCCNIICPSGIETSVPAF